MKRQPSSKFCFICGVENPAGLHLRFDSQDDGTVICNVTLPAVYQGYPGLAHGGIVAAMLDEACGRAHMTGDPPRFLYTATLNLRYRKNTPVGKPLKLVGKVGKIKERTATASAYLYDENGSLLAEAEALLVALPGESVSAVDLEQLGWKVYEDEP